jgi:hypothetical protein
MATYGGGSLELGKQSILTNTFSVEAAGNRTRRSTWAFTF